MDSLVANYGSDDEGADSPPVSPKAAIVKTSPTPAPTWNRQSLFGSLPPPKSSAPESSSSSLWDDEDEPVKPLTKRPVRDAGDNPERRAPAPSFFSSLPPPKTSALESSLWDDEDEPLRRPKPSAPESSLWDGEDEPLRRPKTSAPESSLWDGEDEPLRRPKRNAERESDPNQTAPAKSRFASLPPPKIENAMESSRWDDEDEPLRRPKRNTETESDLNEAAPAKSFFASLPPPKIENVSGDHLRKASARIRKLEAVDDDDDAAAAPKRQMGSLSSPLLTPKLEPAPLPSGFFDSASSLADPSPQNDNTAEVKPSSLFERLPLPASFSSSASSALFAKLPPPSAAKPKQKVVEFRPPINYALLETTDEDDDFERSKKRSKTSKSSDSAPDPKVELGLVALLPPPKHSLGVGAALGGGNAHGGRRTVMETASDPYRLAKEVTSTSGNIPKKVENAELNVERPATATSDYTSSDYGYGIGPAVQSSDGSYAQPDSNLAQGAGYGPSHFGSDGYSAGNGNGDQSWQYPESNPFGASTLSTIQGQGRSNAPGHVLAEVMKKERRKGRDEQPPQMIEVKQADLTGGSKLREDQMRSTGIAFGPSYKPAASNKDKPSKIHRRKHQIGALYFDMKQNEMNLLDRRAKGNLTKAETQAKYGW